MPSYSSSTDNILANVHRYGRFYLASVLMALLATLLLLSAHRERDAAAPPPGYAAAGPARQPQPGQLPAAALLRPRRDR